MRKVLTIFTFFAVQITSTKKLEFVQALWRHGDRAPLHLPYPNDQYTERSWRRGWGQLTSIGMQQLHELGDYFRKKYIVTSFVPSNFSVKDVYLRSSDSDRALTSAQAFLYGFYPAGSGFTWTKDTDWQPIPVHASTPGEPDLTCKATSIKCQRHEQLVQNDEATAKIYYDKKYANFFSTLSGPPTGVRNLSYSDINGLYDIQRELNHDMRELQPSWVTQTWPEYQNRTTMELIYEMRTVRMTNLFDTEEKAKLTGGSVLNVWLENAIAVAESKNDRKMLLYSSHDGVMLALLNAFGAGNSLMVPYAATLIMEIYSELAVNTTNSKKYIVEMYYRNSTQVAAHKIRLPRCPDPCHVELLYDAYQNMTVKSYDEMMKLCGTPTSLSMRSNFVYFLIVFLCCLFFE